jgi:hypothetical protein
MTARCCTMLVGYFEILKVAVLEIRVCCFHHLIPGRTLTSYRKNNGNIRHIIRL